MCWEWDGVIWGLIGMQMAAVSSGQATKKRQRVVCACPRYLWKSGQNQNVWLARRSPLLSQTARITDRLTRRKNGPCKRRGMSAIGRRRSTLIFISIFELFWWKCGANGDVIWRLHSFTVRRWNVRLIADDATLHLFFYFFFEIEDDFH